MKYNLFIFIINKEKKQILENLVYSAKKDYNNKITICTLCSCRAKENNPR